MACRRFLCNQIADIESVVTIFGNHALKRYPLVTTDLFERVGWLPKRDFSIVVTKTCYHPAEIPVWLLLAWRNVDDRNHQGEKSDLVTENGYQCHQTSCW